MQAPLLSLLWLTSAKPLVWTSALWRLEPAPQPADGLPAEAEHHERSNAIVQKHLTEPRIEAASPLPASESPTEAQQQCTAASLEMHIQQLSAEDV